MKPITDYEAPTDAEQQVVGVLDQLQTLCHSTAKEKGFWKEQDMILSILNTIDADPKLVIAVNNAFHAQKGDLMHSELGERTEAARKDLIADKLPLGFTGEEEELADVIIRILDYAGRRQMRLGLAVILKMRYNLGRPFMHGKAF